MLGKIEYASIDLMLLQPFQLSPALILTDHCTLFMNHSSSSATPRCDACPMFHFF
jgi:hypothetical protein